VTPRPIVDYLVARESLPPRSGLAYDYLLAGDGLYLRCENKHLEVCIPIAAAEVRGLVEVKPLVRLKHGRLPVSLWERFVRLARAFAEHHSEILVLVTYTPTFGYEPRVPPQEVTASRITYQPLPQTVLELHSHHVLSAYFSATDDVDEVGFRLYGVVGRLDREPAEVQLRIGAYGYFQPVAFTDVFAGEPIAFVDLSAFDAEGQQNATLEPACITKGPDEQLEEADGPQVKGRSEADTTAPSERSG
jgi:PRTRC genetic system protein A